MGRPKAQLMKIYQVGGSVRDKLLGLTVTEYDWVIVGATVEELLAQGFKPVGKDFPVFLHPKTHDEYALARTERKSGTGHKEFTFHAAPDVTLEEDLLRRDLTINAIAKADTGELTDPYNGQTDLNNKILRHVSNAFTEDPLRVYRVARFMAKLHHLGFTIAPETKALMLHIVNSKELETLSDERIWQETYKALLTKNPEIYFQTLLELGALQLHFSNMSQVGIDNLASWTSDKPTPEMHFACACFEDDINLKVPKSFAQLQQLTVKYHTDLAQLFNKSPEDLLKLLKQTDALRRTERWEKLFQTALWLHRDEITDLPGYFKKAIELIDQLLNMDIADLVNKYQGQELAKQIQIRQITLIANILSSIGQ